MSCIKEILNLKGDKEFLHVPNRMIVVEGGGEYRGFEYLIIFTNRGHRCGYVAISSDHPIFGSDQEKNSELEVPGGITFHDKSHLTKDLLNNTCEDEWLGFDAMQAGCDLPCHETTRKYFKEERFVNDVKFFEDYLKILTPDPTHKNYDYMVLGCKSLIDQLISIKNTEDNKNVS